MKIVNVEIQIPDDRICKLNLLQRFLRKKLSAEYRLVQQRADGRIAVIRSKGFRI